MRIAAALLENFDHDSSKLRLLGAGDNDVFEYLSDGEKHILRLSRASSRKKEEIIAETDFIRFVREGGGPAVRLDAARNGDAVVEADDGDEAWFAISYLKAKGSFPGRRRWGRSAFEAWGEATGRLHELSARYLPPGPRRLRWDEDPELLRVAREGGAIGERCSGLIGDLREGSASAGDGGLIHADLHPGNIGVEEKSIRFFDFADCQYDLYAKDIAVAFFFSYWHPDMIAGALGPDPDDDSQAGIFLKAFLAGYARRRARPSIDPVLFHKMLKLQRCLLWGILDAEKDDLGVWEPVYAKWTEDIASDAPFLREGLLERSLER